MTTGEVTPELLAEISAEATNLMMTISEQQNEINWLSAQLEARFTAEQSVPAGGRYDVYTTLIDHDTLRPIGVNVGTGVVTVPSFPLILENDGYSTGATIDASVFSLSEIDDVTLAVPEAMRNPWIGIFDVVTNKLLVVYKFSLFMDKGSSLTVTFKSKMVAW